MDLLSHPFRLERNGDVATVEDGTDEAYAEGIAITILTRKGERDLAPDFGLTDPTYDEVDLAELNVQLTDYGPPVEVTAATITYPSATTERIEIAFERADEE